MMKKLAAIVALAVCVAGADAASAQGSGTRDQRSWQERYEEAKASWRQKEEERLRELQAAMPAPVPDTLRPMYEREAELHRLLSADVAALAAEFRVGEECRAARPRDRSCFVEYDRRRAALLPLTEEYQRGLTCRLANPTDPGCFGAYERLRGGGGSGAA